MKPPGRLEFPRQLVLSATPLTREAKRYFLDRYGPDVAFAELSFLRRQGLLAVLRELRSRRHDRVVVTGTPEELILFGGLLRCLALVVRAPERVLEVPPTLPQPIRWSHLPGILVGLGLAAASGLSALFGNIVRALTPFRAKPLDLLPSWKPERCLYLRPTLMFGVPVGGSVAHVAGVVNALQRRGAQVCLVSAAEVPMLEPDVRQVRVEPSIRPAYPPELNSHSYHRLFFRSALAHARRVKPDLIYQRYTLNDLTGLRLRRRLRVPLVLEFNGSEVWVQRHWGRRLHFEGVSRRIEEANLRSADLVVVISEEGRKQVLHAGVPEHHILFYPNCVDPIVFDPGRFGAAECRLIRTRLGVPEDADLLTFVGTFGKWHGADVLAAAIRKLVETEKPWLTSRRVHFLFVGDGPVAPRVREILGEILEGPFVTLAGLRPQADAPGILAASDVLFSPQVPNADGSPFFGSPTKLFEYMAMARLIVASDLDQIGQVLRGWRPGQPLPAGGVSEAAVLVAPGSEESLVRGIRVAVEMDPESRRRMAEKARFYLMQAFTWEKNVEALFRVLEHSLARSTPGGKRPADREAVA